MLLFSSRPAYFIVGVTISTNQQTNEITTSQSTFFLEKLIVAQLIEKVPAYHLI